MACLLDLNSDQDLFISLYFRITEQGVGSICHASSHHTLVGWLGRTLTEGYCVYTKTLHTLKSSRICKSFYPCLLAQ